MTTWEVGVLIFGVLISIIGYLESAARQRNQKDFAEFKAYIYKKLEDLGEDIEDIKDDRASRNETNLKAFADLKELVLTKMGDLSRQISSFIKS